MKFLYGITWLLIFQLVGESLAIVLNLPVPGPVIGMMLLFAALLWRGRSSEALDEVSDGLLSHLSLLFVPAGVGIMVYFHRIASEWLPIGLTLLLSTVITMVTTALTMWWVMQWSQKRLAKKAAGDGGK
ncbi:CidA/LrgA family protein [Hydrogenovibrio thermophilus]|jgi:holin-like protein|uniref:CidA/LrgA family protein n=1 Tax=Hydrogenovibrio thermophilus TaxID=265883 RepID=A0A410H5A6_9GAMM|nr:CidA/LrgA family protein [Hydrogenovibrio thermophilus]QAB16099.1 CidA/LrgA family protein [Hydrogenovibrio thermophilus]